MESKYENWIKIHFEQGMGTSGILTSEEVEKINKKEKEQKEVNEQDLHRY